MNTLIDTLRYFVLITIELIVLFVFISALVEIILMYVPEEKIRRRLSGAGVFGNIVAAGFGALTPFLRLLDNTYDRRIPECRGSFRFDHVFFDRIAIA